MYQNRQLFPMFTFVFLDGLLAHSDMQCADFEGVQEHLTFSYERGTYTPVVLVQRVSAECWNARVSASGGWGE